MFFSSSPTLSHSFFSLILLQVVHLKHEENGFFWFIIPILLLMVVAGRRHRREEDDSGDSQGDPQYEVDEGFEEEEGNVGRKDLLRHLWQFVTKVEGRGGGSIKFVCPHDCHDGKPYTDSYTRLRRHFVV
jgi:hypothetical protein